WDELGVQLRLGCRALGLRGGVVDTCAGPLGFAGLVIATGASPRLLSGSTSDLPGVYVLRTIEDAQALRTALVPAARIAIIGAGWIGAEVATAAALRGCQVVVVEAESAPLPTALPAEVAMATAPWYAEAGVQLRLGSLVIAVKPGAVVLAGGER